MQKLHERIAFTPELYKYASAEFKNKTVGLLEQDVGLSGRNNP